MAISLVAAVFMAIAGPFGTWREPLLERLGFWVIGAGGCAWLACSLDLRLRRNRWLRDHPAASALGTVALLGPTSALLASKAAALLQGQAIDWSLYWTTVPQVTLFGAGVTAILLGMARRPPSGSASTPMQDATLGGLLPLKYSGARLFAVQAQDHYVRVHTDQGTALIWMPFEEAVARAGVLDGARVHRSWWVAQYHPAARRALA